VVIGVACSLVGRGLLWAEVPEGMSKLCGLQGVVLGFWVALSVVLLHDIFGCLVGGQQK
jgi:hypothetical protein